MSSFYAISAYTQPILYMYQADMHQVGFGRKRERFQHEGKYTRNHLSRVIT